MARAIWKGTISFGLVNVPVELYPASQSHTLSFSMLDKRDFSPVGYKRYNKSTGAEVPWNDIVKGYEYEKDQYVVMSDEDFRRANVQQAKSVEIATFVDAKSIPPQYFETPYYLVPGERGQKVYALLRETMRATGKVGVGQVVIRTSHHLAAVVPVGEALMMLTLRYANELRKEKEFDFPPMSLKTAGVTAKEMELAQKLIADMSGEWKPEEFEDTYNEDLLQRIEEKVKHGETKVLTKPEAEAGEGRSAQVIDLMELLKRSIDKTGARAAPDRGAKRAAANADEEAAAPRAATRARKTSAAHKATAERKPAARRKRA
ncbi:MAG TPA: Ku protein [Casimicrobiaceae bacterium]|nr:Ku protein [Casimicrobiaceae bacterium]